MATQTGDNDSLVTGSYSTENVFFCRVVDDIKGAAQLCNKIGESHFTSVDEDIAKALSAYCCISIVHVSIILPFYYDRRKRILVDEC